MPVWILLLLSSVLIGATVLLFAMGIISSRSRVTLRSRFDRYMISGEGTPVSTLELQLAEPFSTRVIVPLLRRLLAILAWMWPKNRLDHMRVRLLQAGSPGGITTTDFIGIKGWCTIGALLLSGAAFKLVGMSLTINNIVLFGLFTVLCFFLPDVWLSRHITRRQQDIVNGLPDILDMLVAAMEAGLSFENALLEVTNRWRTTLALELVRVQRDVGIGGTRRQALVDLSVRTGVSDIEVFVAAINQAEELGVSIARTLTIQAEEMRVRRRQRAQEMANKAPIKILFPMVFLIFPAIFAVLLGPGVPALLKAIDAL